MRLPGVKENDTYIGDLMLSNINMSNNTNNYIINPLRIIQYSNDLSKFAIQISFQRNSNGITGVLIRYHMMCALLVITASLNFLIDPKVVPGRAGMLVTLFLVLANFFSDAQVTILKN